MGRAGEKRGEDFFEKKKWRGDVIYYFDKIEGVSDNPYAFARI